MIPIVLSQDDLIRNINHKFNSYLYEYNRILSDKDEIFSETFFKYLTLSSIGIFPEESCLIMKEMIRLHFGKTWEEIYQLTMQYSYARYDAESPLSESEFEIVRKYHSVLFGKFTPNPNPFDSFR